MMAINAPNSDLWFWTDNNWLYSLAVEMVYAQKVPDVVSMSWGWSEDDQCSISKCNNITSKEYVDRVNSEYIKLGLRGVTITVSSGDAGAPGRTNEDCMDSSRPTNAAFPGSSPYITSVGANYLKSNNKTVKWNTSLCKENGCATGTEEYVTNFNDTGWTAGGGISKYSNRNQDAKWQDKVVSNYLSSGIPLPKKFNKLGRSYPDVTTIGHYCPVMDGGFLSPVDGTSCSSPIFASIVTILNAYQRSKGKQPLGFLNPVLYKMAEDNPKIFNDIIEGNNWCTEQTCCNTRDDGGSDYGFKATKGYDPVYGLGSPNVGLMKEWLDKNT